MKKEINNTKVMNSIAKNIKLYFNQDEMLSHCLWDIISGETQADYEYTVVALYRMGKTNLNTFLKQTLLKSMPNNFPSVWLDVERQAQEVIDEQEHEEAEWAKLDAIEDAEEKAKQAVRKKLVASLTKEQKKLWKELNH